jgi:hypothetical protein
VDADGDAVFTWQRYDGSNFRIQARARSAGGILGTSQNLSRAGEDASEPQIAVDADGDAVFTWRSSSNRIQTRARSSAGVLGPIQTLSRAGQDTMLPQVAVDTDGDAVFTWENITTGRIQARARSSAGVLGPIQNLSRAGETSSQPQVDVEADGDNAVFTWVGAEANTRIKARARSSAGVLSPIQTLSAAGQDASNPQVASDDSDGDAVFTWQRWDGSSVDCCYRIQARARSVSGVLSSTETISSAGQHAQLPQVGLDAGGNAVFTWLRYDGTTFRAQARALSATGLLSAVQTLSPADQNVFLDGPQVGVDADGDAVFTWQDFNTGLVKARVRSSTGVLSAVETLSAAGQSALHPQIAVDSFGDAAVTWQRSDGTNSRIQAAFGP